MMLPYHWTVLSAQQIDRDLYGMRVGSDSPTLVAFPSRAEAIKSGIEFAARTNRGGDGGQEVIASVRVEQFGNALKLRSNGWWNQLNAGDKMHLYRIDSTHCSEAWQPAYEGSHEYYTRGVTDYEEVIYDTLTNHIRDAGLTIS